MNDISKQEHDLDEIVFKVRNKEYGAYNLRKGYKKHVTIALTITLILLLLTVTIPLIASYINRSHRITEDKTVGLNMMDMNKPKEDAPPPPPPPPPPEAIAQKVKFVAPVVVEDSADTGPVFVQDDLNTQVAAPINENEIVVTEGGGEEVIQESAPAEIFTIVEEQPTFGGGEEARQKFLSDNIKYPDLARENGIQGTVYVTFVVEPDGSISNVQTLKGIGAGCDEEAIRVVKMMPKWTPGKQRGKNVRVKINMPIKFVVVE
jgi:periplasmic protein TonB